MDSYSPLLTPAQLADLCGVPVSTVYQWNHRRVGPPAIRVGKHVRYRLADVNTWLDEHTTEAGA